MLHVDRARRLPLRWLHRANWLSLDPSVTPGTVPRMGKSDDGTADNENDDVPVTLSRTESGPCAEPCLLGALPLHSVYRRHALFPRSAPRFAQCLAHPLMPCFLDLGFHLRKGGVCIYFETERYLYLHERFLSRFGFQVFLSY